MEMERSSACESFRTSTTFVAMLPHINLCAQSEHGGKPLRFATIDIQSAYFDALASRKLFIKWLVEDCLSGEDDVIGELLVAAAR